MERITGPHLGFYVASYACETGGPGERYIGYAKLCRRRPESYWDASCLVKLCGERLHADAQAALDDVEALARHQLGNLVREPAPAAA
jgi:hypothetical protein